MQALFASGRIVDLILLFVVVEAALLAASARRLRFAVSGTDILAMLLPGALLLLALRAALRGETWLAPATWLLLALFAHLFDVVRRLRGTRGG
jgi:hypothetical protein